MHPQQRRPRLAAAPALDLAIAAAFALALLLTLTAVTACGGGAKYVRAPQTASETVTVLAEAEDSSGAAPAPAPSMAGASAGATNTSPAQVAGESTPTLPEQLVVEGRVAIEVEDAAHTAAALRTWVAAAGGRVVSDQVNGAAQSWHAALKLRLPPAQVDPLVAWLDKQGNITSKQIQATDVSRTLFDQGIALANDKATLERLRKLLDAGGLKMEDILAVEKEMTRVRGEIEQLEGNQRFLRDRVAQATIDVDISVSPGEREVVMNPKAKVYPGPRFAALTLFSPDGRKRTRLGAGVVMHMVVPDDSLEMDVFDDVSARPGHDAEGHGILVTYGARMYSDFLGRGKRAFLNPYLGFRLGYGHIGYSAFAVEGEVGLELYKSKFVMVDVNARALGLLGNHSDGGLVSGGSVVFAF